MRTQLIEYCPANTVPEINTWEQKAIQKLFFQLGITAKYVGYDYLSYAVLLALRQPERLSLVTKWLYPDVAKRFCTNWKTVERGMRLAVEIAWSMQKEELERIANCKLEQRPIIVQFIVIVINYLFPDQAA